MYVYIYMPGGPPWVYMKIHMCIYAHMPGGLPQVYMCIRLYVYMWPGAHPKCMFVYTCI